MLSLALALVCQTAYPPLVEPSRSSVDQTPVARAAAAPAADLGPEPPPVRLSDLVEVDAP